MKISEVCRCFGTVFYDELVQHLSKEEIIKMSKTELRRLYIAFYREQAFGYKFEWK